MTNKRFEELNRKLERGELTEAERAEIHHAGTMALLAMRDNLKKMRSLFGGSKDGSDKQTKKPN